MNPYILLVEDDEISAYLTLKALQKCFFPAPIIRANDGKEALDHLNSIKLKPRLLLLDIKLPKFSGIELLAAMRKIENLKSIPVIIFTASDMQEDKDITIALGIMKYMVKPMDFQDLISQMIEVKQIFLSFDQEIITN